MPTKWLNIPMLDKALICFSIPSFWSINHQPEPNCIFPTIVPSWKFPVIVANNSLSRGFKLYNIVFANWFVESKWFKNRDNGRACSKSPIESNPVSGPNAPKRRSLLLRMAPRWNCCVQPLAWSKCAKYTSIADLNCTFSFWLIVLPVINRSKICAISCSVYSSA